MSEARAFIEVFTGIDMHSTVKGHDKHLRVLTFDYGLDIALRDGLASGRCRHRALALTFCADVETPMLLDALTKNSAIGEVKVTFYRQQGEKWDVYSVFSFRQVHVESMSLRFAEDDGLETIHVTATLIYGQIEVEMMKKKYADQVFDLSTRQ